MNFIGHLFVARLRNTEPSFGLGSMLPDFAGMAGVRMREPSAHNVREGIRLHHATDQAFHHADVFVELMALTFEALTQRNVARGPSRAVAHIGVEMLIDGELLLDEGLGRAYLEAIGALHEHADDLVSDAPGRTRLVNMGRRLERHGVPHEYRNTDAVVQRLVFLLSRRPRLCLDAQAAQVAEEVLPGVQEAVRVRGPELLSSVVSELSKDAIL